MAQNDTSPNGVLTAATNPRGQVGGNRKKQKRREKELAKKAALGSHDGHANAAHPSQPPLSDPDDVDSDPHAGPQGDSYSEGDEDDDDDDEEEYDDEDDSSNRYAATAAAQPSSRLPHQHHTHDPSTTSSPATNTKRKNRKKRRSASAQQNHYPDPTSLITSAIGQMPLSTPHNMSGAALRTVRGGAKQDRIWNTSTQEERERIKEFWLSLSEDERKSLLKIEKEAVLRKMKEQQKHSCSCTVCGRKRTAIEEELEVLYDAYYEELEQYAHQKGDPSDGMLPPPRALPRRLPSHPAGMPPPLNPGNAHHRTSRVHEIIDDEEEDLSDGDDDEEDGEEEEEEEEEYSDDDDEEELYSDDEEDDPVESQHHLPRGLGSDFFQFGNSLTVKGRQYLQEMLTYWLGRLNCASGGILTVADDLLKNDGKKFIEMMEQLAERRMQREQEAEYAASQPAHSYPPSAAHDPPLEDDDYDDDDEEEYDSQEDYDEEDDEDNMVMLTPSLLFCYSQLSIGR